MRCPNCGSETSIEHRYCYECGKDLTVTEEEVKVIDYRVGVRTKVIVTVAMMLLSVFFLTGVSITFSRNNDTHVIETQDVNAVADENELIVNKFTCSKVGNDINEVVTITHRDGVVLEYAKEYSLNTYGMTEELINNLVARFNLIDKEVSIYRSEVGINYTKSDTIESNLNSRILDLQYVINPAKVTNKKVFSLAKYYNLDIANIVRSYKNEGYDCK